MKSLNGCSDGDCGDTTEDCTCAEAGRGAASDEDRRSVLKYALVATSVLQGLFYGRASLAETAALSDEEKRKLPPQVGDRLTYLSKRKRGPLLRLEDLETAGKQLVVVPVEKESGIIRDGSRHNRILLQRFDLAELSPDTAPLSAEGAVAYSAICTHNGCPVTAWDKKAQTFMCPCHQSQFNPRNSAAVVDGPAPRKLPALPLSLVDGEIAVADAFTAPVGFGRKKS